MPMVQTAFNDEWTSPEIAELCSNPSQQAKKYEQEKEKKIYSLMVQCQT